MTQRKLYCYPRYHILSISSEIAKDPDAAVISISSSFGEIPELEDLGISDSTRCLRLSFDDVSDEEDNPNLNAMSIIQARQIVSFIENHLNCNFYIHCDAGISRSQAVVRFILDCYGNINDWEIRKENPPEVPNIYVLSTLKRIYLENLWKH